MILLLLNIKTKIFKTATRFDLHHNSSSLIDVTLVRNVHLIIKSEFISMSIVDHDMVEGGQRDLSNER